MDGMIELPFALPTAVAGITLSKMYAEDGMIGRYLHTLGLRFLYRSVFDRTCVYWDSIHRKSGSASA